MFAVCECDVEILYLLCSGLENRLKYLNDDCSFALGMFLLKYATHRWIAKKVLNLDMFVTLYGGIFAFIIYFHDMHII